MYTIWSQIRNVFTCTKQPLEEIVTPIVNIEEIVSVTDIKEPDPTIYEEPIYYETETKINNDPDAQSEFEEYEQSKIRENKLAWLAAAERDVAMLKQAYTQASKFVTNSEGQQEAWTARMTSEEFDETIQKQFDKFKQEFLNNLDKETDENN